LKPASGASSNVPLFSSRTVFSLVATQLWAQNLHWARDVEEPARKRVLVIDDDARVRAIVAETLRGEGYRVEEAADGAAGLDEVRSDPPHLVLLDMRMAGMDGMQFLDELHQTSGATEVPIIIITGTP